MSTHTILVVDDDKTILEIITQALQYDGYAVITAENGESGLEKLAEHNIQLVISDQKMPGMTGLDFLAKVKQQNPEVLTIMLTGYADVEIAMDAINKTGVYKFLVKPINVADLRVTVKRALELGQLVSERDELVERIKTHEAKLKALEKKHPGITIVERDEDGTVILDLDD